MVSLGGRAWEVVRLDERRSIAHVKVTDVPGRSRWLGGSRALSEEFCQSVRSLLLDDVADERWSRRAATEIAEARSETSAVHHGGTVVETDARSTRTKWWTFAGLKANYSLAQMLQTSDGVLPRFDNFFVEIPQASGVGPVESLLNEAGSKSTSAQPIEIEIDSPIKVKFWDCLPNHLRDFSPPLA